MQYPIKKTALAIWLYHALYNRLTPPPLRGARTFLLRKEGEKEYLKIFWQNVDYYAFSPHSLLFQFPSLRSRDVERSKDRVSRQRCHSDLLPFQMGANHFVANSPGIPLGTHFHLLATYQPAVRPRANEDYSSGTDVWLVENANRFFTFP